MTSVVKHIHTTQQCFEHYQRTFIYVVMIQFNEPKKTICRYDYHTFHVKPQILSYHIVKLYYTHSYALYVHTKPQEVGHAPEQVHVAIFCTLSHNTLVISLYITGHNTKIVIDSVTMQVDYFGLRWYDYSRFLFG